MRIVSVDSITGTETLAKDILNKHATVLMPSGTVLKKEYINRLKELNVEYIYVEDELGKGIRISENIDLIIREQCYERLKEILLKFSFYNNDEHDEIKEIADSIINEVINEQPEVIYSLSSIRDRSESTYLHSLNVCVLSVIIAIKLKIPKTQIKNLAIGSLLHDIGFTYMELDYHNLQLDTCTQSQWKEIKKHVIYGYSAIEKIKWLSPLSKDIIISHHEREDRSGFPFRLHGDRIKKATKIVAVCDEFDRKVYGFLTKRMKVHEAIDYIVSQAGVKFDLDIVKAFVDSIAAYPTGSLVITNENEKGIVLRQNPKCPTRPVIRIIETKNGNQLFEWIERDLTQELTLFIKDVI